MTGFGQSQGRKEGLHVNVEICSLNSKFLDASIKLPGKLQEKELEIRNLLGAELVRGKVSLVIEISNQEVEKEKQSVNHALFTAYYREFEELAGKAGAGKDDLFRLALQCPDVLQSPEKDEAALEKEWAVVKEFLQEAIERCNEFRTCEGQTLEAELKQYIDSIGGYLSDVKSMSSDRSKAIREKIQAHQLEIISSEEFDKNRFEQEMIYYLEKLDMSEELVRLKSHLDYFMEVVAEQKTHGKKLGFISQEIGREVNTIGSKANYAPVQKCVVCMKDELEKIKEQLLNII